MSDSQKILDLAKQNNGVVTTAMVVEYGILRGTLKHLVDTGRLEKVARGVYLLPDAWDDELFTLQNRFKRGVFSLGTALFLCDLADRTPDRFHMTFPATYNLSGPKAAGIVCSGAKEPLYSLGVTEMKTPGGHLVRGYGAERTLCDILRPCTHTDIQLAAEAFKRYTSQGRRMDLPRLSEYAKALGVEKRLRSYLEVLL